MSGNPWVGRERPLIIAHRGHSIAVPENTLEAYRRAIELGVEMIECDVNRTKDGELVMIHDWTLDRTTSGSGRVEDMTLSEIRDLDAGSSFDPSFAGLRVPTTAETLDLAREAGARSKIAVASEDERIDPVGACVGHRGARVQAVVSELYDEKIDIVRWSANISQFVAEARAPARSVRVLVNEEKKSCLVLVPDTMLSLAIGKSGQNVRLAARLTGWRIDIRSESQDAKAALTRAAEEVQAEELAEAKAAAGITEALPEDETGSAVSYGDEVMITADMLRMLDDEEL